MWVHIIAHSAVIKLYWICLVPQSYSTAHLHVTSGPGLLHVLVLQVVHGPRVGPRALLHVARLYCACAVKAPLLVAGAGGQQRVIAWAQWKF